MKRLLLLILTFASILATATATAQIPRPTLPNGAFACFVDRGGPLPFVDKGGYLLSPLPQLPGSRDLNGFVSWSMRMTNDGCRATCGSRNFIFAGTQSGSFCFCGNSAGRSGVAPQCNIDCRGRPGEKCGGVAANSVSYTGASGFVPPAIPAPPANGGQCVINVNGAAYNDFEIHTWNVSGPPTTLANGAKLYPMIWSLTGGGGRQDLTVSGTHSQANIWTWTVDSTSPRPGNSPPITAVKYQAQVLSDGMLHFGEQSNQGAGALHDHQQMFIDGVAQAPSATAGQILEWKPGTAYLFTPNQPMISGTFTYPVDDQHPYGYARRPGATGSVHCTWNVIP